VKSERKKIKQDVFSNQTCLNILKLSY